MTAAEALRQLRLLIADQRRRPAGEVDWAEVRQMLFDVEEVLEYGSSPLIELRLRRYRRRSRIVGS